MKLQELQERIGNFLPSGYGHIKFKVYSKNKDNKTWHTTDNTRAIDRINSGLKPNAKYYGYTEKQAYLALYKSTLN
jgi:hypothetical protein